MEGCLHNYLKMHWNISWRHIIVCEWRINGLLMLYASKAIYFNSFISSWFLYIYIKWPCMTLPLRQSLEQCHFYINSSEQFAIYIAIEIWYTHVENWDSRYLMPSVSLSMSLKLFSYIIMKMKMVWNITLYMFAFYVCAWSM